MQVNTAVQALVVDEETRQRIIALRKEILGEPKKAEAIEVGPQPSGLLSPIETETNEKEDNDKANPI